MTFKVTDLMIQVSDAEVYTCTTVTRPTGCIVDSLYEHAGQSEQGLSALKDQLRQRLARS